MTTASSISPKSSPERKALLDKLRQSASRIDEDPQVNSVFDLARALFLELEAGDTSLEEVESRIDELHLALAHNRATDFRDQHHAADTSASWRIVETQLDGLAAQGWEAFQAAVETPTGGIVFTAHPTFALPPNARQALARHAEAPTKASLSKLGQALSRDARDWSSSISLEGEHSEVQDVIANAQGAMSAYAAEVISAARTAFPDQWRTLSPALPTLASWVGYDLDGRTDINWWQSVALRLQEKAIQLRRYSQRAADLGGLDQLVTLLVGAAAISEAEAAAFSEDLSDPDKLVSASRLLTDPKPARLVDIQPILDVLDEVITDADDEKAAAILAFRCEVEALQLGTARIHLRVNAAQVRAVISRDLGLETEDRDLGRLALQQLSDKAGDSTVRPFNFADLYLEQSTARRQIMMCALWLQYIDAGSPIRFLIAEAENPATVMGTLYLARQYGIEDKLDISPLFETPEALESGGRFIERLLEEPAFVAYLRQRGYLSIQLGFSDAGRFIGQVAADMAIERIHNLITIALAEVDPSIGLLIFNTHGESMGRGAYPGSFEDRFDHVLSCYTRGQARRRGIRLLHEVSFQGGDGFLHFATPALAETTYAAWCTHLLSDPDDCLTDPFYNERDFSWDTYRSLRLWHERLFNDPDYGRLLGDFATNFLVRAGSRQRRRSGGPIGPRSLRAISHNATLQQLGVPVNTAGGLGSAIRRETERLIGLLDRSPRMRHLLSLAVKARVVTSLPALRAYAQVYDPSLWVALARRADPDTAVGYRRIYYSLRGGETFQSIRNMADKLSVDLGKFDRLLAATKDAPSAEARHEGRLDLHVLHALRQSVMMHAFALAGRLPSLSGRHGASQEDFIQRVMEMRIGDAADLLEQAFPKSSASVKALESLASETSQGQQGYDALHKEIIQPLRDIDRILHKASLAISQAYGAYG